MLLPFQSTRFAVLAGPFKHITALLHYIEMVYCVYSLESPR